MKQLEYPYDSDYILRKKKAIRRELLAREDIKYIERGYEDLDQKIRDLGGIIEKVDSERDEQKFKMKHA